MRNARILFWGVICCGAFKVAGAHDAKGLLILESLPEDVRAKIEERIYVRRHSRPNWQNDQEASVGLQSVVRRTAVWTPGTVTSVCFMDGAELARERVKTVADTWPQHGSKLRFDFGDAGALRTCDPMHPSLIRVTFSSGGYASQVGQDALLVPSDQPTLFLQGLDDPATPEGFFGEIVLHEFGHAIGFEHEHQSPRSPCESEFDWKKVYAYFATLGWKQEKVDQNLKKLPDTSAYAVSSYDPMSIMHYQFDPGLFKDPSKATCVVGENMVLSPQDIAAVGKFYGADSSSFDLARSTEELKLLSSRAQLTPQQRKEIEAVSKKIQSWTVEAVERLHAFDVKPIQ